MPRASTLGRALRQDLIDALEALRPSGGPHPDVHSSRAYQILKLRYVEALDIPQVLDRLALSRSVYYAAQQRGIEALSSVLREKWGLGEPRAEAIRQERSGGASRRAASVARDPRDRRAAARESAKTNLPLELTSFVGCESALT